MATKWRYLVYILCLHLIIGGMAYWLLREHLVFFLGVELLLSLSVYQAYRFYRTFLAPLRLVQQSEAALADGDVSAKFLPVGSPEVDRLIHIYNRMIDNLRAERREFQQQHFFLEKLIETADLGVVILDFDGQLTAVNPWAARRLGPAASALAENGWAALPDLALAEQLQNLPLYQALVLPRPGNQRWRVEKCDFIDQGFPRHFLLLQDITSDLLAAEKQAYGRVIRMMAHEVNNSTGATNSLLNSLLESLQDPGPGPQELLAQYLPVVIERGERMNHFMRHFANVVRLPPPTLHTLALGGFLGNVHALLSPQCLAANISLQLQPPADGAEVWVKADAGQLEQVIINAVTNARESLVSAGDRQGATITLGWGNRPSHLTVADNGPGIPADVAEQLFQPFFSNKPTGQGVGLTLSRDILEQHGAHYSLATESDGWTRLRIVFG